MKNPQEANGCDASDYLEHFMTSPLTQDLDGNRNSRMLNQKMADVFMGDTAHQLHEDIVGVASLAAFELPVFLKGCKRKHFSAKEVIYHEGACADSAYAICSGRIKLLRYLPNGRARIVRLQGKRAWLGLSGLLDQPYEHTAIAIDDVEVYSIPVGTLLALRSREPRHFVQFMEKWYGHLREADTWIASFSTGAIKARVARLVRFLADLENDAPSAVVELLTVHEMADMLGVTSESVSRVLAEFKRDDILHRLDGPLHDLYMINSPVLHSVASH